jgi:hypothetical protein
MVAFLTDAPCLNWGHNYGFTNSVRHPRSDSIGLLVYDGMRIISGAPVSITGPLGQRQPCCEGSKIQGRLYGVEL